MSESAEQSPDEPLGNETFEQGDEALDEQVRIDPDFLEAVQQDPSLDPNLSADELEREEAGVTLDDPELIAVLDGGIDDPDGGGGPDRSGSRSDADEGWDLDA
jgi:hypothetical protein